MVVLLCNLGIKYFFKLNYLYIYGWIRPKTQTSPAIFFFWGGELYKIIFKFKAIQKHACAQNITHYSPRQNDTCDTMVMSAPGKV